jgi:drug/metabolite transporter (DMT)-like permease
MPTAKTSSWIYRFLFLGLIWGSSFLFISFSLQSLPPVGVAFWRTAIGALTLLVFMFIARVSFVRGAKTWLHLWIAGLFMSAIPAVLFSYAMQDVSSALASIINASTPIFTVLAILIAFRAEKPKPRVIFGLIIGLAGVLIVLGIWQGLGKSDPLAIIAMLLAVSCYGIGGPYIRKYVEPLGVRPEAAVFGQTLTSAFSLLPLYAFGSLTIAPLNLESIGGILALGILGTGVAYVVFYQLLAQVGSAIGSAVTYFSPVVGVILGVIILNEELHWYEPVGAAVLLFGAAVAQGRFSKKK